MKKNKFMKLASGLLVLCLMTTCVIGATLAKYVTSGNGTDTARVAKWGVKITGAAETFAKEYAKDDTGVTLAGNTVVSTEDVVAPGTSGSMTAFAINGTPEVAVNVAFTGVLELGDKWAYSDAIYYCPLEITVGDTTFKGTNYTSADLFEEAVENKIATYTKDYAANTDLSTIGANAPAISWKWAYEGNDDVKDTYLGDQGLATISLEVTVTVTQID